jgi:adenylate kinase family enzyme
MERVIVVGTSCSGKTTLAKILAKTLNATHIELDAIHWLPNWQARPPNEMRQLTTAAVAAECWVADGNYSIVRDIVWNRATTLVWLNYSFPLVFGRALWRTTHRVISRQELFAGNRESFRQSFLSRDSILLWVLQTYHRRQAEYPQLFKQPQFSHLNVLEFNTPRQTDTFVNRLRQQVEA